MELFCLQIFNVYRTDYKSEILAACLLRVRVAAIPSGRDIPPRAGRADDGRVFGQLIGLVS
jgi:hypothetical protein